MVDFPDRWQLGAAVVPEVLAQILYRKYVRDVLHEEPDAQTPAGWDKVATAALDYITAHCLRCMMARNGP